MFYKHCITDGRRKNKNFNNLKKSHVDTKKIIFPEVKFSKKLFISNPCLKKMPYVRLAS